MGINAEDTTTLFAVVMNHEEQYSIWPAQTDPPLGWTREGMIATKAECLDHIEKIWVDMRPLSLRKHMATVKES